MEEKQSMKSYTKSELARAAGVSGDTFRRWLKTDREFLRANNVQPKTKYLPPVVVKYLCEKYCIDVWFHGYVIWTMLPKHRRYYMPNYSGNSLTTGGTQLMKGIRFYTKIRHLRWLQKYSKITGFVCLRQFSSIRRQFKHYSGSWDMLSISHVYGILVDGVSKLPHRPIYHTLS